MMHTTYPFDFDFSGYSDEQLLRAARMEHHMFDRGDLCSLLAEMATRIEEKDNRLNTS